MVVVVVKEVGEEGGVGEEIAKEEESNTEGELARGSQR